MSRVHRRCLYVFMWLCDFSYEAALSLVKIPERSFAHKVFLNPYFTRLWIVQEILLAPQLRAFCGLRYAKLRIEDIDPETVRHTEKLISIYSKRAQMRPVINTLWVPLDNVVNVMRSDDLC